MSSKLRKCLQKQPLAAQHIGELKAEQSRVSLLFPISLDVLKKPNTMGFHPFLVNNVQVSSVAATSL